MYCKLPAKHVVMKFFNDHHYSQEVSLDVGVSFLCVRECLGNERLQADHFGEEFP